LVVVGVGKATKKLIEFLDCTKVLAPFPIVVFAISNIYCVCQEYRTTCLLGCETDSYDSEGARVRLAPWHHVSKEKVENALDKFKGEIMQTPPM